VFGLGGGEDVGYGFYVVQEEVFGVLVHFVYVGAVVEFFYCFEEVYDLFGEWCLGDVVVFGVEYFDFFV